jgi:3D (Asp-Asp-Asp) domain-containing protein/septal ring factor EnvC (AmiA/AmiB activator)
LLALAASSTVAIAVALPASGADSPSSLRQQAQHLAQANAGLGSRSHAAVLTLYALDTGLARARAELASVRSQIRAVAHRQAAARRELMLARRLVAASQRNLANRLRAAYEQGDSDPLAIVLGAKSLDDALAGMETVDAATATDRRVVAQARRARAAFTRVARRLDARARELHRLEAAASAKVKALAAAQAEREAYISHVAVERRLNAAEIGRLESRAASVEAQARRIAIEQAALPPPPAPLGAPAAGPRTLTVLATAYTLSGNTATGAPVGYGVVAVDPSVIPLGTRLTIPGYGEGVAADTGGSVRGAVIDLWFPTAGAAAAWGRRTVTITLH